MFIANSPIQKNNIAGSSNGRIMDSESIHLGSNPSPAAINLLLSLIYAILV